MTTLAELRTQTIHLNLDQVCAVEEEALKSVLESAKSEGVKAMTEDFLTNYSRPNQNKKTSYVVAMADEIGAWKLQAHTSTIRAFLTAFLKAVTECTKAELAAEEEEPKRDKLQIEHKQDILHAFAKHATLLGFQVYIHRDIHFVYGFFCNDLDGRIVEIEADIFEGLKFGGSYAPSGHAGTGWQMSKTWDFEQLNREQLQRMIDAPVPKWVGFIGKPQYTTGIQKLLKWRDEDHYKLYTFLDRRDVFPSQPDLWAKQDAEKAKLRA